MTVFQLLDRAQKRMKVAHVQDLAPWVGTHRCNIAHFRAGRMCPTDIQVVKLAGMADIDPAFALVCVAHYRSQMRKKPAIVTRAWLAAMKASERAQHQEHAK